MSIISFFLERHDPSLVILAAIVCLVASYGCVGLLRHARRAEGRMRWTWTIVAALSVGFGIWATHFVAVLAFKPGFTFSYDLGLTAASLGIAILVCGLGISMAIRGSGVWDHFLGGAVVGVAISTMHYTGIAALVMGGNIGWNTGMVAGSVVAGIALGGLSFLLAMGQGGGRLLAGASVLTLAICAMHFTAMGAADFSQCFPVIADGEVHSGWLSVAIAFISVLILGAVLGSVLLDDADSRRTALELDRQLRDAGRINEATRQLELAMNHMAQGLGLFDANGYLQIHNARLSELLGVDQQRDLAGLSFRDVCRLCIIGSGVPVGDLERHTEDVLRQHLPLINGAGGEIIHPLGKHRTLSVTHSPVGDGSWVVTIDDITERQRSAAKIEHLARHDGLTGLPNRAQFNDHFEALLDLADDSDNNLAVIAIDLDRFKEINDTHGHVAGDTVLKALAERLSSGLRDGEVVARLGGDEFAALKSFISMDALREFLTRIEKALFNTVDVNGVSVQTAGSIGVAIFPEDGADRSKLLNNADLAMYRAKGEFDRRIAYYEREMDEHSRARREMAQDIWKALELDAFTLVYQVQKSVLTGEITGYEVLLRWDRPGHGNVSPADFIPVAEECGAISAIGDWVLKTACMEAARWPEEYKVAVNVSGLQLAQLELVDTVRKVLATSGLAPERLELEVTETSIIADRRRALRILREIKEMGVSIAIDDFGTGYSSLETLRSFPFDKIKLDRSFMNEVEVNEQSKAIVRAILALGRSLHVPVLAEGVETWAQLEVLKAEGCNEAQGYLLGRPGIIDWHDILEPTRIAVG